LCCSLDIALALHCMSKSLIWVRLNISSQDQFCPQNMTSLTRFCRTQQSLKSSVFVAFYILNIFACLSICICVFILACTVYVGSYYYTCHYIWLFYRHFFSITQCLAQFLGFLVQFFMGADVGSYTSFLSNPDEERKGETSGWFDLVGLSAESFLQCFDTVGWVAGRASSPQ